MWTLRIAMAPILGVAASFVACSSLGLGSSGSGSSDQIVTITVTLGHNVTLAMLAFREGIDGDWQKPTPAGDGRYEIRPHGLYTVESVCLYGGTAVTSQTARTLDDPRELAVRCVPRPIVDPLLYPVTGTITPAGRTALDDVNVDTGSDGSYSLRAPPGTYDLVALTTMATPPRLAIRRGVTVAGPTTVPPIDVAIEGVAMLELPISVTGVPADARVNAGVWITTPSTVAGLFTFDPGATLLHVVPDAALLPTDRQEIAVGLTTDRGTRQVVRRVAEGSSSALVVPPPYPVRYEIANAAATGRLTVHWDTLAPYEQVHVAAGGHTADSSTSAMHQLDLSASYLAATGETRAELDTDLPGYDPTWRIDFQSLWGISGSVTSTGAGGADVVSASDFAFPATDSAP